MGLEQRGDAGNPRRQGYGEKARRQADRAWLAEPEGSQQLEKGRSLRSPKSAGCLCPPPPPENVGTETEEIRMALISALGGRRRRISCEFESSPLYTGSSSPSRAR